MNNFKIVLNSCGIKNNLLYLLSNHTLSDGKTKYSIKQWKNMINYYLNNKYNDEEIYKILRTIYSKDVSFSNLERATHLALNIIKSIPKNKKIYSLLDYGCANGAITRELYKKMNIEQKNVYGSDVQYYDNKDFNFIKLEKNNEMEIINTGSIKLKSLLS